MPASAAAEPTAARPPAGGGRARGLAVLVCLFAAVAGVFEIRSVDLFWHLAAGRWILAHGALPRVDPFRFTSGAVPWVDHEWGFQVLVALAEKLGGLPGVVGLRAAVLVTIAALLWALLRDQRVPAPAAAVVVAATLLGLRSRLLDRPELLSLVALAALLLLLRRLRVTGAGRWALAIVALVGLWANFHPGVLAAPFLILLYLAGAWADGGQVAGRRVVTLPAAAALAILANPWGVELYAVPWRIRGALADLPATNPDWAPLWRSPQPWLLVALAALAGLALITWRRQRRIDWPALAVVVGLVPLVLSAARHSGLLWLAAAGFAGECLGALTTAPSPPGSDRRVFAAAVAALALAAALCLAAPWLGLRVERRPGFGVARGLFPDQALRGLAEFEPVGNLYNSPVFGGYLLWRLYPPRQVFLDTRNEVNPGLLRELAVARADPAAWQALLERHAIDGALVAFEDRQPASSERPAASALLFPSDRFALVAWDDAGMLFVRRTPARAARLVGVEYRYVQPEDWRRLLRRAASDEAFRAAAAAELRRKLLQEPECGRAQRLLAALGERP